MESMSSIMAKFLRYSIIVPLLPGQACRIAGRMDHPIVIRTLHERTGQRVAVLVDEYDKPILDALDVPEVARANRDYLRGLYAVIKDCDAHVRFSFLTGVSKFSKASLFSGLNNLEDITFDPRYSTICGYSDADLDTVFAPELPGLDRAAARPSRRLAPEQAAPLRGSKSPPR